MSHCFPEEDRHAERRHRTDLLHRPLLPLGAGQLAGHRARLLARTSVDWAERLTETQRRGALWSYSLFLHGEDSVADNLSPYIDAAPLEEQKYFLATQQVDEARHAVFFARFMREVLGFDGDGMRSSLERTRPELTWGFRHLFALLDRTADELRADRSAPKLAAAITLYHLVVEATVAQTGQHFIDDYLERSTTSCPASTRGWATSPTTSSATSPSA